MSLVPAAALYWLLLALPASLLPQWDRLPFWLPLGVVAACLWRMPLVANRIGLPGTVVRFLLTGLAVAGVFREYKTLIGPDAGVAFLIVLTAMKMLELKTMRDAYVGIMLGYFVLAMNFLFAQTLGVTLFVGLVAWMLTTALVALHSPATKSSRWKIPRLSLVMLAQALPVMLVLFVLFPRLPPLWTLNLSGAHARTGLSDTMSPGEIAELSQSTEVAFRAEFTGETPPKGVLYWRGVILDAFDGKTWKLSPWLEDQQGSAIWYGQVPVHDWRSQRVTPGDSSPWRYRIILEPTDRPWLFSLWYGEPATKDVGLTTDFRLISRKPVSSRLEYEVRTDPHARLDAELSIADARTNLILPVSGNPKSRAMALDWRQHSATDEDYINRLLSWFAQEKFSYSLQPPLLGDERIDDFLFNTRSGFCEHYASSFVFMMRAAGIPARVVTGYQGGEKSAAGNYLIVRQLDAHAWAEVWLEGKGWVTFDPTSAVSPERVQRGIDELAQNREFWGSSQAAGLQYNGYRWLSGIRRWADYVNYAWYKNVLQYNTEAQDSLMERLLGDRSTYTRILVMVGSVIVILGVLSFVLLFRWKKKAEHPADRIYLAFCERMAKKGYPREPGEGVWDYSVRLASALPQRKAALEAFTAVYIRLRYQETSKPDDMVRLKRLSREAS